MGQAGGKKYTAFVNMKIEIGFFFGLRNCSFLWEGKVDHDKGMVNDVEAV